MVSQIPPIECEKLLDLLNQDLAAPEEVDLVSIDSIDPIHSGTHSKSYSGFSASSSSSSTSNSGADNRVRYRRELVNRGVRVYRHPVHPFDTRAPHRTNKYFADPNLPLIVSFPGRQETLISKSELLTGLVPEPYQSLLGESKIRIPEVSFQWSPSTSKDCPATLQWFTAQGVVYPLKGTIDIKVYGPNRRSQDFGTLSSGIGHCTVSAPPHPDYSDRLQEGDVFVVPKNSLLYAKTEGPTGVLLFTTQK